MAEVGDGERRKDIFIFLLLNVHYQGSSLNVSEIIGAPRRLFAKHLIQPIFPRRIMVVKNKKVKCVVFSCNM